MRFPRRPRYLLPALAAIIALIVLFAVFAGIWTDYLWFRSVHYGSVFTRIISVRLVLFLIGARPVPQAGHGRWPWPARADIRAVGGRCVAYLAAFRQQDVVWCQGPAVPSGCLVLRVHLPVHQAGARIRAHCGGAVGAGRGYHPLPLRRPAHSGPW